MYNKSSIRVFCYNQGRKQCKYIVITAILQQAVLSKSALEVLGLVGLRASWDQALTSQREGPYLSSGLPALHMGSLDNSETLTLNKHNSGSKQSTSVPH